LFSGAIQTADQGAVEGAIVEVYSSSGEYLGTGHFQEGSIAVKIFSFHQKNIDYSFWQEKIRKAYHLREALGLTNSSLTTAYRLVFTEGDGMPGLIVDWYDGTAVIQTHTLGMHLIKPDLVRILGELYGERLKAVYDKSKETMHLQTMGSPRNLKPDNKTESPDTLQGSAAILEDGYLYGTHTNGLIRETGHTFHVDWEKGQKTGFFLDQRSNRMFTQYYANQKKVLNAFCYSGAFSIYALKGGATMVHSIDSSKQAIEWTEQNISENGFDHNHHKSLVAEAKKFLTETNETYDMIILDPPAFAKHHNITHNALQAYIHINTQAIRKLTPGGLLMTFSCSQAITREMFRSAIQAAALGTGREIRVLHQLSQGPDHPVSIYHPEGEYLKGLILEVG
jgi:23S rRNA (cytosine1962-C5)-methyltransferase